MSEDIFVPTSRPEDALVGPLHTVTYVTAHKEILDRVLREGYGMRADEWLSPPPGAAGVLNDYLGFRPDDEWEVCCYRAPGEAANVNVRVFHVSEKKPPTRPAYDGLYRGGATISFPIVDLYAHEKSMKRLGVESTVGVKELEFTSPTGETYSSAEVVYKAPDNVFLMGVTRPEIFVPVGPMNAQTGVGGPAYSARCVAGSNSVIEFLSTVMGYEIRRDMNLPVGEESAILLPEGQDERFVMAFAPGSATGYVILMDHGEATKNGVSDIGPASRGIGMWSFSTPDLDGVCDRAEKMGRKVMPAETGVASPYLNAHRSAVLEDPDGFPMEFFEVDSG